MKEEYEEIRNGIEDAMADIENNDSHLIAVEVHGPHSGYTFDFQGFGKPWKCTEIEK